MSIPSSLRALLGLATRSQAPKRPKPRARLQLETLEGRCVPAAGFFQGFEVDTSGWVPFGDDSVERVASGIDGIASQAGGFHARVTGGPTASPTTPNSSAFTRWGGYTDTFPAGGYTTSIGIYLDMGTSANNDTRFDFSSAVSTPEGKYRRDFIFNGGFYKDADVTGSERLVISASNNSVGWPNNPARNPLTITASGWYTFQHRFYDAGGGQLAVDLSVTNSGGTVLRTWTLSDPSDIIGSTVGGNNYGWFANNQFSSLAIDNSFQSNPRAVYVDDDWGNLAFGADPDGAGPAQAIGYDSFVTIQGGVNAVAAGGTVYVRTGTYVEQLEINKTLAVVEAEGDNAVIKSPATLALSFTTNASNKAVIYVHDADNVMLRGLTVDGDGQGNSNYRFVGIAYHNAGGTIDGVEVTNIRNTPFDGMQGGTGIYGYADNAASPHTLTVRDSLVHDYQKNGITMSGAGLMAHVTGNTVTGAGPTDKI